MSVFKRGKSPYYSTQFEINGVKYGPKSTRTKNKKEAQKFEDNWRREIYNNDYLGHKKSINIHAACDNYVDDKKGTGSERTAILHTKFIKKHQKDKPMEMFSQGDLMRLFMIKKKAGLKPRSLNQFLSAVKCIIKLCDLLDYKTPKNLKYPWMTITHDKIRYLSEQEEETLLFHLHPSTGFKDKTKIPGPNVIKARQDNYDLVVLLLDTAARKNEIVKLKWSQVDLNNRTINLQRTKVKNESIIYMTDRVHQLLTRRYHNKKKKDSYVFTSHRVTNRGKPVTFDTNTIRQSFVKAGLSDCSLHTLRHTAASRLIQAGLSLYEVGKILGHRSTKTTEIYAHLDQTSISKAAAEILNKPNNENVVVLKKKQG